MEENLSKEEMMLERDRIMKILQDMKVLTRDLEDYKEQRDYKKIIRNYEQKIRKIEKDLELKH